MAATILTEPVTPASCYRPLQFIVQRTDPSVSTIEEIFIADAGDVATLGNGLAVGDVVVYHTTTVSGAVPAIAGQTILISGATGYNGVWEITNAFAISVDKYMVIDAPDAGDVIGGAFRVWLNNYTVYCRVHIYTDPAEDPQIATLHGSADVRTPTNGNVVFNVDLEIRDYFSHRIDDFAKAVPGGTIAQNAHGVTALFYKVWFAEVYDVPGETDAVDPFDGDHTIFTDDLDPDDIDEFRVAANTIHPYAGAMLTWATAGLGGYVCDTAETGRLFLTDAPRTLTLADTDRFRLFFLLANPWNGHFTIRVNSMSGGVPTGEVLAQNVDLGVASAAMCIAVGPADLAPFITVPGSYRVFVSNSGGDQVSEYFNINVDTACKEVRRVIGCLNPMGGFDTYTFTGREIEIEGGDRSTISKPYSEGTGFDFTERTYRNKPNTAYMISSRSVGNDIRKWLARAFSRSPNVLVTMNSMVCPAVIQSKTIPSNNTGGQTRPVTLEYRLGVDNLAQRA